jgi:hypothetical protein
VDKSDPFWMRALFIMLPAVIAPLIAWLTSTRATSRRSSELDFLLRRIELVERVQKIQGQTTTGSTRVLTAEVQDIVEDLTNLRLGTTLHAPTMVQDQPSRWRRWILAYDQPSRKGSVYKLFFYILVVFGILGGIGTLTSGLDTSPGAPGMLEQTVIRVLGVSVYLGIGLAFRYAAIREYHKRMQKISAQIPATAV